MWLDDVFVPWERVFLTEPSPEPVARWLFWHQLYCWLAKAEFTLGLALACAHAMGLAAHEPTIEYLIDLIIDVQTVRSCQTAAELDPGDDAGGLLLRPTTRSRGGQHRDAEGAAAHGGDPAHPARLLAGGGAVATGTWPTRSWRRGSRSRSAAAATRRCSARRCCSSPWDHVGLGARRARVGLRAARQRRRAGLARPAAPQLQPLQRAGQRGAAAARHGRCRRSISARSATRRWRPVDR